MKKLYLLFIFIILILTSCSFDDQIVKSFVSSLYNGSTNSVGSIYSYYLKDKGEIPYIRIELLETIIEDIEYEVRYNDGNVTIRNKNNNEKCSIENNVITIDNYDSFFKPGKDYATLNVISRNNKYVEINGFEYTEGSKKIMDLNDYDIYLYQTRNACYIPFAIFETIFLEMPFGVNFVFNGRDYYSISDKNLFSKNNVTIYGENYYSLLNGKEESEAVKKFSYNQLLFILDNFYGLKKKKEIESFSSYFSTIGINLENYQSKLIELTNYYLDDPHSSYILPSVYDSYNESEINRQKKTYLGQRQSAIQVAGDTLTMLRDADFRPKSILKYPSFGGKFYVNDNIAYIIYDEFEYDSSINLYETSISKGIADRDGFAYLYYFLNYIRNHEKNVNKVVIDISLNSGGYVDAAVDMLGFIKKDFSVNFKNTTTNSNIKINLNTDCNLDKNYKDLDSFEGVFDFYILTSNASFSCANTFASMLQEQNAATIIGEDAGGGACVVQKATLIDGIQLNISGPIAFSDNINNIIEAGVKVDYKVDRIYMYKPAYMNLFINNL